MKLDQRWRAEQHSLEWLETVGLQRFHGIKVNYGYQWGLAWWWTVLCSWQKGLEPWGQKWFNCFLRKEIRERSSANRSATEPWKKSDEMGLRWCPLLLCSRLESVQCQVTHQVERWWDGRNWPQPWAWSAALSWSRTGGLEIDPDFGGFCVNVELYACSNVGSRRCCMLLWYKSGRRRLEHHDHAFVSGRLAGENITGAAKSYWHQSVFWNDLSPDAGCEALGPQLVLLQKQLHKTTQNLPQSNQELLPDQRVKQSTRPQKLLFLPAPLQFQGSSPRSLGGLQQRWHFPFQGQSGCGDHAIWNIFNRMPIARKTTEDGEQSEDLNEVAKLFNIDENWSPQRNRQALQCPWEWVAWVKEHFFFFNSANLLCVCECE